jgi:hypothetical protein
MLPVFAPVRAPLLFHLIRASPLVQGVELSFALSWRHLDFTSGLALLWRFASVPCFHHSTHPRPRIRYSFPRAGDRRHACRPKTKTDEGLPWRCDELALALSRWHVTLMPGFVCCRISHFCSCASGFSSPLQTSGQFQALGGLPWRTARW